MQWRRLLNEWSCMTDLVLIRHGQTNWNLEGRWQGQADPSLNETGRTQAQHAASELRAFKFAALYSSNLRRAYQTALILGDTLGLPVMPEPRLREIHLGGWQGMFSKVIQAYFPSAFREWHETPLTAQPPGGEMVGTLSARVMQAINDIVARHPNQRVAVVSHELPIAIVRCCAAGVPLEKLREWIPANGAWVQVRFGETLQGAD